MRRRHVSRQGAADPPAGIGLAYRNRTTYSRATDYHVRGRVGLQPVGQAYSVFAVVTLPPPTVTSLVGPAAPVAVRTAATATIGFADAGPYTVAVVWGDSAATTTTVSTPGSVPVSHPYAAAGLYSISTTVTDASGQSASVTATAAEPVVVYDPAAGSVVGAGRFTSPSDALAISPTLTGPAGLAVVAGYKRGATVPTGVLGALFVAGHFALLSTGYDWLVVSGTRTYLEGTGTVNGTGAFRFLLTTLTGAQGSLTRLTVWDKASGQVVYDTQPGAANGSDPVMALTGGTGGAVRIHRR